MPHRCLAGCGKIITYRFAICRECEKKYGNRSTGWPAWLRYSWSQTQAERRGNRTFEKTTVSLDTVAYLCDDTFEND